MMRTPDAVDMAAFTAADPSDREAFDAWIARERAADGVQMYVVTENGGFAGTAALNTVD
ncbi:MAG TPA: GNAT family N-acetyltransferase, partial [Microbacterium sp.]|nr:GNAT family N-acetyltransferase [Microbacterium sp.]